MRTNIVIEDRLMKRAMMALGTNTKRETVEEALKIAIRLKGQEEIIDYFGKLDWEGDLETMRRDG